MPRVRTKRPIHPPSYLQSIIDGITQAENYSVLQNRLERFHVPLTFERPEERALYNWVEVLNCFDDILGEYAKQTDVERTPCVQAATKIIPGRLIVLILRASRLLLENASHDTKTVYNSSEYVGALLSDDDLEIVVLALEVLCAFMQRPPRTRPLRSHGRVLLTHRLAALAQGWGGKENGLGLVECCSNTARQLPPRGAQIRYFVDREDPALRVVYEKNFSLPPNPLQVNVGELRADDDRDLVRQYPKVCRFSILAAIRRARAFASGRDARLTFVRLRLLALTALCLMHPLPDYLVSQIFDSEPELISEIVTLAKAEPNVGLEDTPLELRLVAVRCLTSCVSDRHRAAQVHSSAGVSSHHGTLPALLRSHVALLLAIRDTSFDSPTFPAHVQRSLIDSPADAHHNPQLVAEDSTDRSSMTTQEVLFTAKMTEALLNLVLAIAMSASPSYSSSSLVTSGTIGTILPLMSDHDPAHLRVLKQGVAVLEFILEKTHNPSGNNAFREEGGLAIIAARVTHEAYTDSSGRASQDNDTPAADEEVEQSALSSRGESRSLYDSLGTAQMTPAEALRYPAPSSSLASRGMLPHRKLTLLRSLLRLLSLGLGSCGTRARTLARSSLIYALRRLIARPFHFGGSIFATAAAVATQIANAEPTILSELNKAGIHLAVLKSICSGLPPSGEAIRCVPNVLTAMCLSEEASMIVKKHAPLKSYIMRLASPFYGRAMHGETPVTIGNGLDELMRHVPVLQSEGNKAIIDFLKAAAQFVKAPEPWNCSNVEEPSKKGMKDEAMESADRPGMNDRPFTDGRSPGRFSPKDIHPTHTSGVVSRTEETERDKIKLDCMRMTVANNAARLASFAQGTVEQQSDLIRLGGVESLLDLRYAPARSPYQQNNNTTQSSSFRAPTAGSTTASLIDALKNFGSHDGGSVLNRLFDCTKKDAIEVLDCGAMLGRAWLIEEEKDSGRKDCNVGQLAMLTESSPFGGVVSAVCSGSQDTASTIPGLGETEVARGMPETSAAVESREITCPSERRKVRRRLSDAVCRLRLDSVLLTGLARGGPGFSLQNWIPIRGAPVAALLATCQRLARIHLSLAFTSIRVDVTDSTGLAQAKVTAMGKAKSSAVTEDHVSEIVTRMVADIGMTPDMKLKLESQLRQCVVPPKLTSRPEKKVLGLARNLALMSCAISRLYASLSRAISSRRSSRSSADSLAAIRSLAYSLGQSLALHLTPVSKLVRCKVASASDVPAAFDYLKHTVNDIRMTLFDEMRQTTYPLVLQAFVIAGGCEALLRAFDPFLFKDLAMNVRPQRRELRKQAAKLSSALSVLPRKTRDETAVPFLEAVLLATNILDANHPMLPRKEEVPVIKATLLEYEKVVLAECQQHALRCVYMDTWSSLSALIILLCKGPDLNKTGSHDGSIRPLAHAHGFRTGGGSGSGGSHGSHRSGESGTTTGSGSSRRDRPGGEDRVHGGIRGSRVISGPELLQTEWSRRDARRSAQVMGMLLVGSFVRNDGSLVFEDELLWSGLTAVVQIVARESKLLVEDETSHGSGSGDGEEQRGPGGRERASYVPDEDGVNRIEEMGFTRERAREALARTGNVTDAMEWIFHADEEDGNAHSGSHGLVASDDEQNSSSESEANEDRNRGEAGTADTEMTDQVEPVEPVGSGSQSIENGTNLENSDGREAEGDEAMREAASHRESGTSENQEPKSRETSLQCAAELECSELRGTLAKSSAKNQALILAAARKYVLLSLAKDFKEISVDSWPVCRDTYMKVKKELFAKLEPLCLKAISGVDPLELRTENSPSAPFFAVELLSAMEYDGFMSAEMRLKCATVITRSLTSPLPSTTSAVWAHTGGRHARRALMATKAWSIATSFLEQHLIDDLGGERSPSDEDAARVQRLSISDEPRKSVNTELARCATCFLLLDSMIRYAKIDKALTDVTLDRDDRNTMSKSSSRRAEVEGGSGDKPEETNEATSLIVQSPGESAPESVPMDVSESAADARYAEYKRKLTNARKKHMEEALRALREKHGIISDGYSYYDRSDVEHVLRLCVRYLERWRHQEVGDAYLALLQLLGSITCDHSLAEKFWMAGGVVLILSAKELRCHRTATSDWNAVRGLTRTVLRHVVEDHDTLTESFVESIRVANTSNRRPPGQLGKLLFGCWKMIARDLEAFVSAFAVLVRNRPEGGLEFKQFDETTIEQQAAENLDKKRNIVEVIRALVQIMAGEPLRSNGTLPTLDEPELYDITSRGGRCLSARGKGKAKARRVLNHAASSDYLDEMLIGTGIVAFSLRMLAELVRISPACLAAFYEMDITGERHRGRSAADVAKDQNSAMNFVIRKVLPVKEGGVVDPKMVVDMEHLMVCEDTSDAARSLFVALCSRSGNLHKGAVCSLAAAAKAESEKRFPRFGAVRQYAMCVVADHSGKVLSAMVDAGLANSLAACLSKIDFTQGRAMSLANAVMVSLETLGKTAVSPTSSNFRSERPTRIAVEHPYHAFGFIDADFPWIPVRARRRRALRAGGPIRYEDGWFMT